MLKEHKLDINKIVGTGKDGRVLKEDLINYMNKAKEAPKKEALAKSVQCKEKEEKK